MDNTEEEENFIRVPFLIKIFGENVNKKYILNGHMMQIGRLPTSHIKINSVNVSRSHCTLNYVNGSWTLKDNNSQNGTYLNGRMLKKNQVVALQTGDIIFLGPPSENPQAFRYDDYLDSKEHKLMIENASSEDISKRKESSKENNTESNPDSNSLIQNSVEAMSIETKNTQEDLSKKNVFVASSNKKSCKVPHTSEQINTSDYNAQQSSKLSSNTKDYSDEKNLDIAQVANDSQSILEVKSDNLSDEENYSFSQRVAEKSILTKRHAEDSDNEHLKIKLALLSEKVKQLEESKSELLKEYESVRNKDKMLDDALAEQRRLKEEMQMCETRVKNNFKTQIMEKLEEELICNICTEVLIKPTVLDCSHTFCEYCITQWKKQKVQCPICRNNIKTQTRVLALDDFIDKTLETLTPGQKEKRRRLISLREKSKIKPKTSTTGRRRRRRSTHASNSSRRRHTRLQNESVEIIEIRNNSLINITPGVANITSLPSISTRNITANIAAAYAAVPDIFLSDSENDSSMEINIVD